MRVLVDVSHPALAHVFAHVVRALEARGHACAVVARDKDVTLSLLDAYAVPYEVVAPAGRGHAGRLLELLRREIGFAAAARRFGPDVITGTSVHAARVAKLVGARSAVLNDDDGKAVPLFRWLAYPLADAIVTPTALAHERWGARHLTYPSYHALFYLHPARFRPDPAVRAEMGLAPEEPYAIVRLSALAAHHDVGVRGVSADLLRALLERVKDRLRVFVSGEKALPAELAARRLPVAAHRVHHALAFARFVLGDSQTMTAEAAVLGTPAVRVNDFVGRISYLRELEDYGLAFGFRPGREEDALAAVEAILAMPGRDAAFAARRERMLAERIDPLPWFVARLEALAAAPA
jgi:hypothetical protein